VLNSRRIHLGVSTCLAVSLFLPAAGAAVRKSLTCGGDLHSTSVCNGCQRWNSAIRGDSCCCRSQRSAIVLRRDSKSATTQSCHAKPGPMVRHQTASIQPRQSSLAACSCGRTSEPAAPARPSRGPHEEPFVKAAVSALSPASLSADASSTSAHQLVAQHRVAPPRDAQRTLCVWRI
jgi:hypothetical protein